MRWAGLVVRVDLKSGFCGFMLRCGFEGAGDLESWGTGSHLKDIQLLRGSDKGTIAWLY
jgi:hypothetical protein